MIYLVTTQKELFNNEEYKIITVEESLELLKPLNIIGLDTETTGINCHKDKLLSLQLGCYDFQIVIDCTTIDILSYKELLESNRLFLFWNAKFDLKWLFRYHIVPRKVYDGFLAEKLMWLGYPTILSPEVWTTIKEPRYDFVQADTKKNTKPYYIIYMNLKKAGEMYCNIELDKSVRGKIIYQGLNTETIIYSANDVKYLEKIKEAQAIELDKKGLLTAIEYENRFVLPLAYMEFCGVRIDVDKWRAKMAKDNETLNSLKEQLDKWLIENDPESSYIHINLQGELFDLNGEVNLNPFDTSPQVTINWKSAKQVIPLFKKFGVDVTTEEGTDSIKANLLISQKDKCSLIIPYVKYKEAVKATSTYGENFLKQIDENTGRLYTNFNSIGTDTARISSGGKDKANKVDYINFLNLPADAETRACFVAEEGNQWISIDYAGQESVIMASIANDKAMINELTYGGKDLHSLTAYMTYQEIPRDTPIKDIKKLYHNLRQNAKTVEFAVNKNG